MTDRSGKVALVTGSARGIGKAIAVRYAQFGTDIVINYSGDEANALKAVAEIGEIGHNGRIIYAGSSADSRARELDWLAGIVGADRLDD